MGGAMYASRDFATGLNNSLMFMRHQRADGRIPGSIAVIDGKVVPQFNKFQASASRNRRWIFTIWAARMPNTWPSWPKRWKRLTPTCGVYAIPMETAAWRLGASTIPAKTTPCVTSMPRPVEEETPPQGCTAVPIASMDVTSYSYACRETLAEIARISGDAEAQASGR